MLAYPSTMLRSEQPLVKEAAKNEPVLITDNNNQYYVFVSEEAFAQALSREAKESAYRARMAYGIRRAKAGIARGEYVEGADAAIAKAAARRTHG